jgi:hypothetical protein
VATAYYSQAERAARPVYPCVHILGIRHGCSPEAEKQISQTTTSRKNYSWSQLLRRVFAIDISICELSGASVRIIAAIEEPKVVEKILNHIGISSRPPPISAARYAPVSFSDDLVS